MYIKDKSIEVCFYWNDMSKTGTVYLFFLQVPLGVILKNEQKNDEMIEILQHLHQYVPTVTITRTVDAPGLSPSCIPSDSFHHVALGMSDCTCTCTCMYM